MDSNEVEGRITFSTIWDEQRRLQKDLKRKIQAIDEKQRETDRQREMIRNAFMKELQVINEKQREAAQLMKDLQVIDEKQSEAFQEMEASLKKQDEVDVVVKELQTLHDELQRTHLEITLKAARTTQTDKEVETEFHGHHWVVSNPKATTTDVGTQTLLVKTEAPQKRKFQAGDASMRIKMKRHASRPGAWICEPGPFALDMGYMHLLSLKLLGQLEKMRDENERLKKELTELQATERGVSAP